ncbi:Hypothetical protein BPA_0021700 (plasmid) [Borrelia parkeri SLO]|uniref:Uncharacterized protein n=2 Tax=Borrelia parkeri TaxID=141 RepID=W5SSW2_BORPR|nr:hypothetical protein [Borrelia parkeri]AHH10025.1 Hypothetical protein BPA_0021700 [Borrelia parkeri SLO]UPA11462.1 hypothetical protein bpSLO_001318 [Borrelia parkeri]
MKFSLRYLVRRLYIKRHRFWEIYMSDEVQSRKGDLRIVNFPILKPEDIDWEYVYGYVKDWIGAKYRETLDITINKIGKDDYYCETKRGSLMNNILDMFYADYKEMLLKKLEQREVVDVTEDVVKGLEDIANDVSALEVEDGFEGRERGKQVKVTKKAKPSSP